MLFRLRQDTETSARLAALEQSDMPIMVADADYTIRYYNGALARLLGAVESELATQLPSFSMRTLLGSSIDVFHKNPAHQRQMLAALKSRHRASVTIGRQIFDLAAIPLLDEKGGRIGTSVEWADTKVRLANVEHQAVTDAIARSQAVIEFEPDGTIVAANDIFLNAMGYTLDEVKGRHHGIFVDADYRASPQYAAFWNELRQGRSQAAEFKRLGKNQKEVWIQATYTPILDDKGRVFKVIKFASDVTEAKLENANYLGQIHAIHRSQAVIEFNLDGTIIVANDNFLRLTGYSLAEVQGKHHRMFVTAADREAPAYREFWTALAHGEYRAEQFKRVTKAGSEIYIQASYNAILDLNGRPWKVVKFAHDVTAEHLEKLRSDQQRNDMIAAVAAGAEELNASVAEIAETMVKSRETSNQAAARVDEADAISQKFNEVAQSTAGIVDMIGGITEQINLLALNATIESARAGAAGRGFAVVASEVKNLANQAKQATDKITAEIEAMRSSSNEVVEALLRIKREIGSVQQYVNSTAAAVEEQSAVANELSASVQRAAGAA